MDQCITPDDIARLVKPLSDDSPVLNDLRQDISPNSNYQAIRNARTAARNDERAAQNEGSTSPIDAADWSLILKSVPRILEEESKDLELVAWYIEALTREHGFKGVAAGFSLARQLIAAFGEQLHPQPDEEGLISQLSSLAGLNGFGGEGALIYPINAIHITQGDSPGPLAIWQCEQVLEADRITDPDKRDSRFKQNGVTRAQLDEALADTETAFLQGLQQDILTAIEEYKQYQQVLDDYSQDDPMPTGQILNALENSLKVLSYIAGDRLAAPAIVTNATDNADAESGLAEVSADSATAVPVNSGPIADRQEALQKLREVAAYFRRAEPHSPISYSIEQAIRWSDLPLTDLIKELIPDDSARKKYQHLSGIGANKPE